ncbi:hypothetical protein SK128_013800 [Halocaridina rubra]|uniref:Exonuclease domain-containing protein n=1 Tax=Halocaridina rubra TaxID=373956 RepID=A0AAN8WDM2_HALRR
MKRTNAKDCISQMKRQCIETSDGTARPPSIQKLAGNVITEDDIASKNSVKEKNTLVIPDILSVPLVSRVDVQTPTYVFFDLETTGLARNSHITQIAAIRGSSSFSRYVIPEIPISAPASSITGLTFSNNQLKLHGQPVKAIPIRKALDDFVRFLGGKKPVVLVAHNCRSYDSHVLYHAARASGADVSIEKCLAGYLDTLPLFRACFKGLKSYRQEDLYRSIFNSDYNSHNALADVKALQKLFSRVKRKIDVLDYSFKYSFIKALHTHGLQKIRNMNTYYPLLMQGAISQKIAERAAASGLALTHLKVAYDKCGTEGVRTVLSQITSSGNPRVTNCSVTIDKICQYLVNN